MKAIYQLIQHLGDELSAADREKLAQLGWRRPEELDGYDDWSWIESRLDVIQYEDTRLEDLQEALEASGAVRRGGPRKRGRSACRWWKDYNNRCQMARLSAQRQAARC